MTPTNPSKGLANVRNIDALRVLRNNRRRTVVTEPKSWFQDSPWNTGGARGHFIEVYRGMGLRLAELKADREQRGEPAGVPGMTMTATRESAYVETTVTNILDPLISCPPDSQDDTMNKTAFQLNRLLAGNWPGLTEHELKARFLDACRTLIDRKSPKGNWKPRQYEDKWQHAKRDASCKPNPWPPPTYQGAYQGDGRPNGPNGNFGAGHQTSQRKGKGQLDYGLLIWKEAEPLNGTIGEDYFRETRNLDISDEVMALMRFHPRVECKALEGAEDTTQPAILSAMRKGGYGGEIVAIHATFVGSNGEKPDFNPRKQCFGRYEGTGAVIYLARPGERTVSLEGIEKTLAAMNATGFSGFTGGSGPAMKGAEPDRGSDMRTLYVGADHGGEGYAEPLVKRAHEAGYEVRYCRRPPVADQDWDECPAAAVRLALLDAPIWEPEPEPEPLPLIRELDPAPDYPVEALGDVMAVAAKALHREVVQAPLAVCCNSVLSAASLALQGHADVELPHGVIKPTSLYVLSILETGGARRRPTTTP